MKENTALAVSCYLRKENLEKVLYRTLEFELEWLKAGNLLGLGNVNEKQVRTRDNAFEVSLGKYIVV